MNKQISPARGDNVVIVVVLIIGVWLYFRARSSQPKYGAGIHEVVMKEFRRRGPRPMPPLYPCREATPIQPVRSARWRRQHKWAAGDAPNLASQEGTVPW